MSLLVVRCWLFVVRWLLLVVCRWLLVGVCRWLFLVGCSLAFVWVVCCLLSVACSGCLLVVFVVGVGRFWSIGDRCVQCVVVCCLFGGR